ncbi:hypothetical protein EVAR_43759_1 [Eumeta japonica]|uniref:Uncharacterized protein n=1 Tax=Eumeta variegata TaxID=151549 RepID=A0A4C1XGE3_EUMVA|nr:hypothetical protein EVAR_43759_1 [Eumeta japonica]
MAKSSKSEERTRRSRDGKDVTSSFRVRRARATRAPPRRGAATRQIIMASRNRAAESGVLGSIAATWFATRHA